MDKQDVAAWFAGLTDQQFAEFFYDHLVARRIQTDGLVNGQTGQKRTISVVEEDELQLHKLYRERITQEDTLINHRMSWMVLSQAFLFATWGTLHQQFGTDLWDYRRLFYLISVVGFAFAVGSWLSLHAARGEIRELRDDFFDFYRIEGKGRRRRRKNELPKVGGLRTDILPRLTGKKHFHVLGHLVPVLMPAILIILWTVLAVIIFVGMHPKSILTELTRYISMPLY